MNELIKFSVIGIHGQAQRYNFLPVSLFFMGKCALHGIRISVFHQFSVFIGGIHGTGFSAS